MVTYWIALIDIAERPGVGAFQIGQDVLIDHAHIDALEIKHVEDVLAGAFAEHGNDPKLGAGQIVENVADVFGELRVAVEAARPHDHYDVLVRLTLGGLVVGRILQGFGVCAVTAMEMVQMLPQSNIGNNARRNKFHRNPQRPKL